RRPEQGDHAGSEKPRRAHEHRAGLLHDRPVRTGDRGPERSGAAGSPKRDRPPESGTRLDPRLIAFYGGAAKLLEDMGRNNLAIRDEKKLALQSDPADLELHVEQGNALRSQGDWKGAIAEFDRVIERDPQRAEAYVARGWARFCAGEAGAETDARSYLNLKGWRDRLSPYMALLE